MMMGSPCERISCWRPLPAAEEVGGKEMLVDLHVHTMVSSPCSQIDPLNLVDYAARMGLHAVCVTEHEEMEGAEVARELGMKRGFRVFRGVEVYTEFGDMLVFGLYRPRFPWKMEFAELLREVRRVGGIVIPAHPCRSDRGFFERLGEEKADYLLANVDALETLNGGNTPEANARAQEVAEKYGLPQVGGSDAHLLVQLGRCLTLFEREFDTEEELIEEIRAGRCKPFYAHQLPGLSQAETWGPSARGEGRGEVGRG